MTLVRDRTLELPHLRLGAREWGPEDGEPVLALHGWLDNAASFDRLAPLLPELHMVAVDLSGHGLSDHHPAGAGFHFTDWLPEVAAAADALGWRRFAILGHSMGAGIASLMPAVFPERIERVVLLEGAGPISAAPEEAPGRFASALEDERRLAAAPRRFFPDLETAVAARARDTELDLESARLLVKRGIVEEAEGLRFTFDRRLKTPSRVRLTEEQVLAFLAATPCPVLAVRASEGWPFPEDIVAARLATIPSLERAEVEGGHHVHLTHPERVASLIRSFFSRSSRDELPESSGSQHPIF
ncbi:MAG: alpha/beta fold hydrolase [Thermoanaerobaculales bacterium]